jgi:DNA-binding transcriptional LysR family regulator
MDDHKLKVFCTVAETKSFSKASEIIHLTQPAVSLQIQALEEIYGTRLFDRSNNTVVLTRAGTLLYKYAREILALYSSAEKEIGEITGLVKGNLSVGASTTIANYLLPAVIVAFRKKYPKIRVNLQVGNTKAVVDFLNSGNIDIGLVEGDVQRQKIVNEKFLTDELVLIMSPAHTWAKRRDISISEITQEPFIIREEGSGTRQMIEKNLEKQGISPQDLKISLILGSTESIRSAVEDGMGVSIISAWAAKKEARYGTLKIATFKDIKLLRDFSLIFPKGYIKSHTVEQFLEFLKIYPFDELLNLRSEIYPTRKGGDSVQSVESLIS